MYITQLVRLNVFFLKKKIQSKKEALLACINQTETKNNVHDGHVLLDIIGVEHPEFVASIQPHMSLLSSFIEASLSIDAWWSGIETAKLHKKAYLNILISINHILHEYNENISLDDSINDDAYHQLQQTLFAFAKAFLNYMQNNIQSELYSKDVFQAWLHVNKI